MIYRYVRLIDSDADMVVVPVACDESIAEGSIHEVMIMLIETGYTRKHFDQLLEGEEIIPGVTSTYYCREGDWMGRWVVNFPVSAKMKVAQYLKGVESIVREAKELNAGTIAVQWPMPGVRFPPGVQEDAWQWWENTMLRNVNCQVELCTADEEEPGVVAVDHQITEAVEVTPCR